MTFVNNGTKKEGASREFFKWSYEETLVLCEVILQFISRNGRNQSFKWREIELEVGQKIGRPCVVHCCKNKYDAMRKEWRAWTQLRNSETGLGWDSTTGKIDASNEWWEMKSKENPSFKRFKDKGVSSDLEEIWDKLYKDSCATGKHVYVPTMEPPIVNVEDDYEDHINNDKGTFYVQMMLGSQDNFFDEYVASVSKGNDHNTQGNNQDNMHADGQGTSVPVTNWVLKQRWKILTKLPQFSVDTQTRTIMATFALHNYIRINSPNDRVFQVLEKYPDYIPADELSRTNFTNVENTGHRSGMKDTRDRIAESLWRGRQGN